MIPLLSEAQRHPLVEEQVQVGKQLGEGEACVAVRGLRDNDHVGAEIRPRPPDVQPHLALHVPPTLPLAT